MLIGEAGVGKTAIIEGLAQHIVEHACRAFSKTSASSRSTFRSIVAGTKYRGQFEERLKKIMAELKESSENIVFIDELHTLVGAGSAEGTLDAANILKPALSRGDIQCIGATTPGEFRKTIERDRALERRFQAVKVEPPTEAEALEIIGGIVERYEAFHQLRYSKDALAAAVYQSNRYIPTAFCRTKRSTCWTRPVRGQSCAISRRIRGEPSWKETVENWKRAAANEDQLISYELRSLERFILRGRGDQGRR